MARKGKYSRMPLDESMNLWRFFLDSISLEKGRNPIASIKSDILQVTKEELEERKTELGLSRDIEVNPTAESLRNVINLMLNRSTTDTHSLENKLIEYFEDKKEIKIKIQDYSKGNSIYQNINILGNNILEILDEIIGKKEVAKQLTEKYTTYKEKYIETTSIQTALEVGDIRKDEASIKTKKCLQHLQNVLKLMNEFYEERQEDEELRIASAMIIGNPRKLKILYPSLIFKPPYVVQPMSFLRWQVPKRRF